MRSNSFGCLLAMAIFAMTSQPARGAIIIGVDRTGGASGNRPPIGSYDGNTDPLPTQPGGLTAGNRPYSDREFTLLSVPTLLEGAEYVRTFNSDKDAGGAAVNYAVTLSSTADFDVFLTIDSRFGTGRQVRADSVVSAFASAGTFQVTGLTVGTSDSNQDVYVARVAAGTYTYDFGPSQGNSFYLIGATTAELPRPRRWISAFEEHNRNTDRPEAILTSAMIGSPGNPQTSWELKDRAFNSVNRHHQYTAVRTDPTTGALSKNADHDLQPFPAYLIGAEYLQIANENRTVSNYSIDATFSEPVFAYLFLDNRLDGPAGNSNHSDQTPPALGGTLQWVLDDGWVFTGDYLGLDEQGGAIAGTTAIQTAPQRLNPRTDSGAGLNSFFAIYTKTFEAGFHEGFVKAQGLDGSNMYGVAVTPVPEPAMFLLLLAAAAAGLGVRRRR